MHRLLSVGNPEHRYGKFLFSDVYHESISVFERARDRLSG